MKTNNLLKMVKNGFVLILEMGGFLMVKLQMPCK